MEAHPVPQNVTSFQFHLVGDMTIKQFAYLASGLGFSYLTFITLYNIAPFIAWPLIILGAGAGAAFAFIPINDRPLDYWLSAFLRAILNPTQRKWTSKGVSINDPAFKNRLSVYLSTLENSQANIGAKSPKVDIAAQLAPQTQKIVMQNTPTPVPTPPPPASQPKPTSEHPQDLKGFVEAAKEAQIIQTKIVQTEHELNLIKAQAAVPGTDPTSYAQHFKEVLSKLQELSKEANEISNKMQSETSPKTTQVKNIEVVKVTKKSSIPFTLTAVPNIINGIVTDALNNYLESAIVVTHDKEGLPVRALRTNKLGQFIAATPLPNGTYVLSIEKDGLIFDEFKVELDGSVIQPIKITAKAAA